MCGYPFRQLCKRVSLKTPSSNRSFAEVRRGDTRQWVFFNKLQRTEEDVLERVWMSVKDGDK